MAADAQSLKSEDRDPTPQLTRLGGGADQAGGRAYNERLALSLIRLNGPLPKAELARLTGLTAQTMTLIVRRLENEGLLEPQEPVRGRIGQPSVPFGLNPMGALSFGVKIGRRSAEVVLCDLTGAVMDRARQAYPYPVVDDVLAFVVRAIAAMRETLPENQRYAGVGVAMPFELWKWAEEVDAPPCDLEGWREIDLAVYLTDRTGLPAQVANDATAACGAELAYSYKGSNIDLLYFFIGSFAGGGVVLNGALAQGPTGNAGALGSMPVVVRGRVSQLIHHASLVTLERALQQASLSPAIVQNPDRAWDDLGAPLEQWIATAGEALAHAIVCGVSVFEFGSVCIDGALPRPVLDRLVAATRAAVEKHDLQGLSPFAIEAGKLGASARALGGAMLPILENYACGQDVLLKTLAKPR